MSTAAPSPLRPINFQRSEIIETVQAFNAVIEAQRFLAPAELRLALILIKRGAQREDVSVSAKNWNEWTGLDKKSRDLAIRGLQKKGFSVSGRGDKTRFRFSANAWREYVSTADRTTRPHVEQKRTPAKPGQMIHPECREQGCFLARQTESNLISIDERRMTADCQSNVAARIDGQTIEPTCRLESSETSAAEGCASKAIPTNHDNGGRKNLATLEPGAGLGIDDSPGRVAEHFVKSPTVAGRGSEISTAKSCAPNQNDGENSCVQNQDSTTILTSTMTTKISARNAAPTSEPETITKRTAPTSTMTESSTMTNPTTTLSNQTPDEWPLTMTAMSQRFITAGADFLSRLVALVQSQFADVSDSELARAIGAATKRDQKSEALWLRTVPTCIENLRRRAVVELECPFSTIRSRTIECEDLPDSKKAVLRKRCALCRKEFQPKHPSDTICSAH
jgi:hypothetical protein